MSRSEEESGKWTARHEELSASQKGLKDKIAQLGKELSNLRGAYITESEQLSKRQKLIEETQSGLRKWEQKREAQVSRHETMKEMQDDFDGFMLGVKEVLKGARKGQLNGVHGAVAELISVPEKLEMAVETALGASLQHVVMDNESVSRQAISFLKQRQLGRATFLPLDVIRPRQISGSDRGMVEDAEGFVGIGSDLVGYDDKYASIVGSLLGNVVIAASLEQANRIAARCQYRYRVVTLEGDVVNAGGSMTGGSQHKKNNSLLSRKRQLDQLSSEIEESERQIVKLKQGIARLREEQENASVKLEDLRRDGDEKRLEEQRVSGDLKQLEQELRHVMEQVESTGAERSGFESEVRTLEETRKQASAELERLEKEEKEAHEGIRNAESARKANESAKEELQGKLTSMKVSEGKLDQEIFSLEEQLRRLRQDVGSQDKELRQNRNLLHTIEQDLASNALETVKQKEDLNSYRLKKEETAGTLDLARAERSALTRKLELEEGKTKDQRQALKVVEDKLRSTEVSVGRLDVELDNILRKLSDDYELSYELAKQRYPVPEDVPAAQADVQRLKRSISALGEVNLGAIEEYQRVHERYTFLSGQKDDLVEAKTTLYQVIREMEDEMSKRFKQTFDAIRKQFGTVFSKLFGGGRADLMLLDPEHMLETGIDIVAQPPGKKLQNLQLLSGGERALTAMALLFAILQVKPVPFCVLDEVEAALDEANVVRFAQYLREFSEQTQFIVVTHRKGTMEEADVLYGVTMEEGGVSKLVSVRLEDEEAEIA